MEQKWDSSKEQKTGVVVRVILRNRMKSMCVCMFTPLPPYKHTCQLAEPKFLFESKGRKTLMSQLKVVSRGHLSDSRESQPLCSMQAVN